MSSSLPIQIAETIQTASINRAPSPSHDVNPSTAASSKEPVTIRSGSDASLHNYDYEDGLDDDEEDEDDIPYDVLEPTPRRPSFGPLPDLRFEQSYLASIASAETTGRVAYITIRDQIFLPLFQGMLWSLALHGWRHWNRSAQLTGNSVGARLRRWWYETNNWSLDALRNAGKNEKLAREMGDVSWREALPDFTD